MSNIFSKIADLLRAIRGVETKPKTAAVILAAGNSTRMASDTPKQLMPILEKPVMVHSLLAFQKSDYISEIILVSPEGEESDYKAIAKAYGISKLTAVTSGGATRNQSASLGFKMVSKDTKYVAIHDAARCLVTPEMIDKVCMNAIKFKAATAATRCTDTVKISGKNKFIDHTEPRNHVWLAQTPQVFLCDLYRAASYIAEGANLEPTDDNSLIENVNHKVKLVECGKYNMKITSPGDIEIACAIMKMRQEQPDFDNPEEDDKEDPEE